MSQTAETFNSFCLYLSENPIRFEPVSSATSVFFDESNEQLIIARSNGAGGVIVKTPRNQNILSVRLEDKGEIRSLNFSPSSKTLAIHRMGSKSVDFMNIGAGADSKEYSQPCKAKGSKLLGVFWCSENEVVFVTDKGVEHYQVFTEKKSCKLLRILNQDINWFVWAADGCMCALSTGPQNKIFYILSFKEGAFTKLPKFEIDLFGPQILRQKDILLIKLYNQTYICQIVQVSDSSPVEVHLYLIKKESTVRKLDILSPNVVGRVIVNVVDNVVVLHHQATKTSFLFDILLDGVETKGGVKFHKPIFLPLPIRPFKLNLPAVPTSSGVEIQEIQCEPYSSSWAVFGPDVILDARLDNSSSTKCHQTYCRENKMLLTKPSGQNVAAIGCYWNIKLDLEAFVDIVKDKCFLIDILLKRKASQSLVLKVCHDLIAGDQSSPMADLSLLSKVFDRFNKNLVGHYDYDGNPVSNMEKYKQHHLVIDQSDFYQHVLCKLEENKEISDKFLNSVVIEYLLSLSNHQIPLQNFISEFLVNRLLFQQNFNQLQQLLQYHVIGDSKSIAFKLLSVEDKFPPGYQIAVDILKRLSTSNESILEIFLSKNLLLTAIRFAHANGLTNQMSPQRFLDSAMSLNDEILFYTVFNFFRNKNLKQRGSTRFYPGEGCDSHVDYFTKKFHPN